MPVKKDDSGRRWVEMEILVPGTPEEVWHAIATGQGNTAWFVRAEIEPRVGGSFLMDFGEGATASGEVTVWNPPQRFGYVERDWAPDAPPVATEITIAGRSGNRCVLRMVHSLFATSDDWDDQLEGFESGWPGFFVILRTYLKHFAGAGAASFMAMAPADEAALSAWVRLNEALGLTGASVGERREVRTGPESVSGIVEHVHQDDRQRYILLRLDEPSPGLLMVGTYDKGVTSHSAAGPKTNVSVNRYFYGEPVAEAEGMPGRWREWLGATFRVGAGASEPGPNMS